MPGKDDHVQGIMPDLVDKLANMYRGSPTSTVSTSTIFSAIGIKFALVEFVISKFVEWNSVFVLLN